MSSKQVRLFEDDTRFRNGIVIAMPNNRIFIAIGRVVRLYPDQIVIGTSLVYGLVLKVFDYFRCCYTCYWYHIGWDPVVLGFEGLYILIWKVQMDLQLKFVKNTPGFQKTSNFNFLDLGIRFGPLFLAKQV